MGNKTWSALFMTSPALLLMIIFLFGPLVVVVILSLSDYQLGAKTLNWVGLNNYVDLMADKNFWKSLRNTGIYTLIVVPCSLALGLVTALLISTSKHFKTFYRTVFFLPVMATLIAMAISWQFILHPNFGFLNLALKSFGLSTFNWLKTDYLALPVLAVVGIWNQFGFNMILFLAGLTTIPNYLYDAVSLDGVRSSWDRFTHVTWPVLGPVTLFVVVVTTIRSFQVFDTVALLTQGGPSKSTEVLLYTIYAEGFIFFRSSLASALTSVFLGIVLVITLIKTKLLEKQVHYG
jgi:multiple sugar transport system permease protein